MCMWLKCVFLRCVARKSFLTLCYVFYADCVVILFICRREACSSVVCLCSVLVVAGVGTKNDRDGWREAVLVICLSVPVREWLGQALLRDYWGRAECGMVGWWTVPGLPGGWWMVDG
ncbi:uncharacterized protein BDZ83DRAFT_377304 [Colletotrichum acutatum]|uniref:Uncharacterized protein n=1 Tax=Glomerella acutata TaxID=27357 RepID=A0AAD8XNE6_GLOAC|nr:uncharacterized protein BDZ83DRAFT_377304 [Colletotrichum acutatum]KAK1730618.1 hypothetical protein BDZ83DRAFT_377304 [Colletotrichum acutatum]